MSTETKPAVRICLIVPETAQMQSEEQILSDLNAFISERYGADIIRASVDFASRPVPQAPFVAGLPPKK